MLFVPLAELAMACWWIGISVVTMAPTIQMPLKGGGRLGSGVKERGLPPMIPGMQRSGILDQRWELLRPRLIARLK
jgi:hypothetical protein